MCGRRLYQVEEVMEWRWILMPGSYDYIRCALTCYIMESVVSGHMSSPPQASRAMYVRPIHIFCFFSAVALAFNKINENHGAGGLRSLQKGVADDRRGRLEATSRLPPVPQDSTGVGAQSGTCGEIGCKKVHTYIMHDHGIVQS